MFNWVRDCCTYCQAVIVQAHWQSCVTHTSAFPLLKITLHQSLKFPITYSHLADGIGILMCDTEWVHIELMWCLQMYWTVLLKAFNVTVHLTQEEIKDCCVSYSFGDNLKTRNILWCIFLNNVFIAALLVMHMEIKKWYWWFLKHIIAWYNFRELTNMQVD